MLSREIRDSIFLYRQAVFFRFGGGDTEAFFIKTVKAGIVLKSAGLACLGGTLASGYHTLSHDQTL